MNEKLENNPVRGNADPPHASLVSNVLPDKISADSSNKIDPSVSKKLTEYPPKSETSLIRKRLCKNEWLTTLIGIGSFVVAVGSLCVAWLTYQTSKDTKDIKNAVTTLSDLAKQNKRQADNSDLTAKKLADQLGEMKEQTNAFSISAQAAQGQLSEMRHQQRAVVSIGGMAFVEDRSGPEPAWNIVISLQNSGSSPTQNLAVYTATAPISQSFRLIQIGPASPSVFPKYTPDPTDLTKMQNIHPTRIPLGPHVSMPVASIRVGESELQGLVERNMPRHALYGTVIYDDNFVKGRIHQVKFCYTFKIVAAQEIQVNHGLVSARGVTPSAELCPFWNCSDDECKDDRRRYDQETAQTFITSATHKLH